MEGSIVCPVSPPSWCSLVSMSSSLTVPPPRSPQSARLRRSPSSWARDRRIQSRRVSSPAWLGREETGLTLPALNGKRLELLKEAVPKLTRVAYVWNPANPGGKNDVANTSAAARTLGLQLRLVEVKIAGDLGAAFARAARDHAGGVLVMADFVLYGLRTQIVDLAARHRLPGIYEAREYVEAGGLLAYGVNVPANFRRAAELVGKILKGAKPAELPVENPARIELLVNLKTARALGLAIPRSLLLRADQVIE
jgi:ABC-type uncharacterized transport system substrate-binding protein